MITRNVEEGRGHDSGVHLSSEQSAPTVVATRDSARPSDREMMRGARPKRERPSKLTSIGLARPWGREPRSRRNGEPRPGTPATRRNSSIVDHGLEEMGRQAGLRHAHSNATKRSPAFANGLIHEFGELPARLLEVAAETGHSTNDNDLVSHILLPPRAAHTLRCADSNWQVTRSHGHPQSGPGRPNL